MLRKTLAASVVSARVAVTMGLGTTTATQATAGPTAVTGDGPASVTPPTDAAGKGDALIAGVLADTAGHPLADHMVRMYAWPGDKKVIRTPKKQSIKLKLIASGKTGADGSYTVARNNKRLPKAKKFDAMIVASGQGGPVSTYDTTLERVGRRGGLVRIVPNLLAQSAEDVKSVPGRATGVLAVSAELAVHAGRSTVTGFDAAHSEPGPFLALTAVRAPGSRSTLDTCDDGITSRLLKKHENRRTMVSSIHATTNGHRTKFMISSGSAASLGTASTLSGDWLAGGLTSTKLDSSASSWGARKKAVNRGLVTRYTMATWQETLGERGVCVRWKSLRPYEHEGGATSRKVDPVVAGYCRRYEKDADLTLEKSKALNYSAGLGVKKIIGFNLASTAGFSSSEKIFVKITKKKRKICGTDKYPAQHPRRIVVKHVKEPARTPCARRPCVDSGLRR